MSGNTVSGNGTGIDYSQSGGTQGTISGNTVSGNSSTGINAYNNVLVSSNTVYGQSGSGDIGINLDSGATAIQNVVYSNYNGIVGGGSGNATINNNRVYNNSNIGILARYLTNANGNVVYSNSIGIQSAVGGYNNSYSFSGDLTNNLVYANTNQGIVLDHAQANGSDLPQVINNTVYQEVGDAIRIQGSSQNVWLRNNILWVDAGYDLYVASDSQVGFNSDYNLLHKGPAINAYVGYWGGDRSDFTAWQAATLNDANSTTPDPNFIDRDGADNILGYTTSFGGYNGGSDDNFQLSGGSAAIDRADTWSAPETDIKGSLRFDDPGITNLGSLDYGETNSGTSLFAAVGTAKNWQSNSTYFSLTLPFAFSLYGSTYSSVSVSTEGFLHFAGPNTPSNGTNTLSELLANVRIAPMWDNLKTNGAGDNIYVDTAIANQVTIRWNATNEADNSDTNFSVVLFSNGNIRFDYGAGNTNLTPTIGISRGDGTHRRLSTYNNTATLANANSVQFSLNNTGFADLGAYEFGGDSNDTTPPQVITTTPAFIEASGTSGVATTQILISFSEALDPIDANAPANYELRRSVNGIFGDGDDIIYNLIPAYVFNLSTNASVTTLNPGIGGAPLPGDTYRLTVHGNASSSVHDIAGNRLDGNRDGVVSGSLPDEYIRTFVILPPGIIVTPISGYTPKLEERQHSVWFSTVSRQPMSRSVCRPAIQRKGRLVFRVSCLQRPTGTRLR